MKTINYAIFQMLRHDLHLAREARISKSLRYQARARARDASLKAYLNVISETVVKLKENRNYYD
jgi:hypothetical protein